MSKEETLNILLLMATLMAYIEPNETTRKFNKLRCQTRKGINRQHRNNSQNLKTLSIASNDIWEKAKKEINNEHYQVSISFTLLALYSYLEHSPFKELFFTEKTFKQAIDSIMYQDRRSENDPDAVQVHQDSDKLISMFGRLLGVKNPTKDRLAFIKLKLKNEMALENKLPKVA